MYISTREHYTRTNPKSRRIMKNNSKTQDGNIIGEVLYAYALKLTGNKHQAEKLIQETMLQIKEKATAYNTSIPFVTWTKMIMENTHLSTFKDADIQQLRHLCFCGSTNPFKTDDNSTYSMKEIYLVMSRLSPTQATVVTLRLKGYNPSEIASKMGITTQCAVKHLAEATYNLMHTMDN